MESRKVLIKAAAAESIAAIAFFIEGKGLVKTAEKFTDNVYDFFETMSDKIKSYAFCKEPIRKSLGYKCLTYKKKYTVVFIESDFEICICEFISSKRIVW